MDAGFTFDSVMFPEKLVQAGGPHHVLKHRDNTIYCRQKINLFRDRSVLPRIASGLLNGARRRGNTLCAPLFDRQETAVLHEPKMLRSHVAGDFAGPGQLSHRVTAAK